MGGRAFAQYDPPLATPRIPDALFRQLRDHYITLLSMLFERVASPIPAPGKTDHGDIDILVSSPCETVSMAAQSDLKSMKQAILDLLQPAACICDLETINLALKHPLQADTYIQLDIHIVPTVRQWRWLLFEQSYGDAWNIIATNLHSLGLVGTDKGLFARDAEIELVEGKKSRIFLSDDPRAVLHFLNLNPDNWLPAACSPMHIPAKPFTSDTILFTAISKTRFFRVEHFMSSNLNKSDRQRIIKRDQYRVFVEVFLPQLDNALAKQNGVPKSTEEQEPDRQKKEEAKGTAISTAVTQRCLGHELERERVFHEALAFFNMKQEWRRIKQTWLHEYAAMLARRALKEERRRAVREEEAYFEAWIVWFRT